MSRRKRAHSHSAAAAAMSNESMALAELEAASTSQQVLPHTSTISRPSTSKSRVGLLANPGEESAKAKSCRSKNLEKAGPVSDWNLSTVLASQEDIGQVVADKIVSLLESDNTIPFIARYRKEQTNNMDPKKLRDIQEAYENLKVVREKAAKIHGAIGKQNKLTVHIERSIRRAQSVEELDLIYAAFKPSSKHTLAVRAKEAGLTEAADTVMRGSDVDFFQWVEREKKGCANAEEVQAGVRHIIADVISKHDATLERVRDLLKTTHAILQCSKTKACAEAEKSLHANCTNKVSKADDPRTYTELFEFRREVRNIRSNEVMAMNRAEKKKFLSIKLIIPQSLVDGVKQFCRCRFIPKSCAVRSRDLLLSAIDDGYGRLIEPFIERQYRSRLNKLGERECVETFVSNLKELLLQSPVRGKVVMGIDPGFTNGCKVAVVLANGSVAVTDTLYMHGGGHKRQSPVEIRARLRQLIAQHGCDTIAIGDGTASRETEAVIGQSISSGVFAPLTVRYCVVSESGVSIYSVSNAAAEELPGLDQNLRSAVGLARRLQDPLVEYIKVEAKHLGVGMYQHDVNDKRLHAALHSVVEECVSFVGVDINYCSLHVLTKVAGLNAARAKAILQHRDDNGGFVNREQLTDVKGIGAKTYEQCAGFIRINQDTVAAMSCVDGTNSKKRKLNDCSGAKTGASKVKKKKGVSSCMPNYLDQTCIHPESYGAAEMFLDACGCSLYEIGKAEAIQKVAECVRNTGVTALAEAFGVGEPTMQLIVDGLSQPLHFDMRCGASEPLFRAGVLSMGDLATGATLTGRVKNVVPFGAFVDIGVGTDALIHTSKIRANKLPRDRATNTLLLGDKVQVRVINVDTSRKRIGLDLINVISAERKAFA